jgi:hypothetical protein
MPSIKWGELDDDAHGGRQVRVRFPWEDKPVTAKLDRTGYHDGYVGDVTVPAGEQVRTLVHYLDYGGKVGVQATVFPEDTDVELVSR